MNTIARWCFASVCLAFAGAANAVIFQFVTSEHAIVGSGFMDVGERLVDGHVVVADGTYAIGNPSNSPYQVGMLDVHAPVFSSQFPPSAAYMIYAQNLSITVTDGAITDFHGFFGWSQDPALTPVVGTLVLNSDLTFSYVDRQLGNVPAFDIERSGRVELGGLPVAVVPEPDTPLLLVTGIAAIGAATRRRSSRAQPESTDQSSVESGK